MGTLRCAWRFKVITTIVNVALMTQVGGHGELRLGVIGTAMIGLWLDMDIQGSSGPSGPVVPKPCTVEPQVATSWRAAPQLFQQLA